MKAFLGKWIYGISMKAVFYIFILSLVSCSFSPDNESFEGVISYKISFTPKSDNEVYNNYQKQKYGEKLNVYISRNGNFKREFLSSGERGFDFFIYDASLNKGYTKWRNIDTIYSSDAFKSGLIFINEKDLTSQEINGQTCRGYFISGIDSKGGQPVSLTYYYPEGREFLDPKLYEKYNDFFYNRVIEKMQSPFYKLIMDLGTFTVTYEIESIKSQKLDSNLFSLPKNIPRKID